MSNEAKTKRKHRTPAEILVEAEERIERLRLRQAKKEAANDPAIKALLDEKEDAAKRIREAKKLLGDGPQSATERIKKHEAWIERMMPVDSTPQIDVLHREGTRLGYIEMPTGSKIVGFGPDADDPVIYLTRTDDVGLIWLERHRVRR